MSQFVKHVLQFSIIAKKGDQKKVNMEKDILSDLLQEKKSGADHVTKKETT